jgi:hypothetical protein
MPRESAATGRTCVTLVTQATVARRRSRGLPPLFRVCCRWRAARSRRASGAWSGRRRGAVNDARAIASGAGAFAWRTSRSASMTGQTCVSIRGRSWRRSLPSSVRRPANAGTRPGELSGTRRRRAMAGESRVCRRWRAARFEAGERGVVGRRRGGGEPTPVRSPRAPEAFAWRTVRLPSISRQTYLSIVDNPGPGPASSVRRPPGAAFRPGKSSGTPPMPGPSRPGR